MGWTDKDGRAVDLRRMMQEVGETWRIQGKGREDIQRGSWEKCADVVKMGGQKIQKVENGAYIEGEIGEKTVYTLYIYSIYTLSACILHTHTQNVYTFTCTCNVCFIQIHVHVYERKR